MFVSLVFVKCLNDETYIFLANIDIQWKLPTTEENAKIQFEAISKMCSFWVCRAWIKPKQRRQQQSCAKQDGELNCWDWLNFSSTGLTGLKDKLPELNGQFFYVLITRDWRSLDFTSFVQSVVVCTSMLFYSNRYQTSSSLRAKRKIDSVVRLFRMRTFAQRTLI